MTSLTCVCACADQELREEIARRDETLTRIGERYSRLSPNPDSRLADDQLTPLRDRWCQLLERLDAQLATKR